MQCKSYTWVTRGTKTAQQKYRTKMRNKKLRNKNWWGPSGHWVMGKCKKVRRTKTVQQNWWEPSETLSASTERSAEQKMVEQKCWWGPLQTLSASTKRSAEQKCGTKSAEQKFGGDPQWPQVQVLKGQQNKNCRRKISGDPWGPKVQLQKGQWNKNWWGPLGTQGSPPNFCFTVFVPLTFLHLHLGSPSPNVQGSLPIFIPLWTFCTVSTNFVPLFLFHSFVLLTLLHLHLGPPQSNFWGSPNNFYSADFYSAIFVLHFLFCWPFCTCT